MACSEDKVVEEEKAEEEKQDDRFTQDRRRLAQLTVASVASAGEVPLSGLRKTRDRECWLHDGED